MFLRRSCSQKDAWTDDLIWRNSAQIYHVEKSGPSKVVGAPFGPHGLPRSLLYRGTSLIRNPPPPDPGVHVCERSKLAGNDSSASGMCGECGRATTHET